MTPSLLPFCAQVPMSQMTDLGALVNEIAAWAQRVLVPRPKQEDKDKWRPLVSVAC